jgi:2-dehydropantoate 2-reductase
MDNPPRVLIVGTGGMACLFGARLAAHTSVTLLGTWKEGVRALRHRGIVVEGTAGLERVPVHATSDPAECADARLALVLVKSWQTARAAAMLRDCLAGEGLAVTLQNGLGNLESLQAALGPARAALGVTTCGATLLGPGHIRPGGEGQTHLGAHPRLGRLAELLRQARFSLQVVEDARGLVWGKLVINASINPLAALLRVPNGFLLDPAGEGAWEVAAEAAEEAAAVAAAIGIQLPFDDPAAQVADVLRRTRSNRASMLQDIEGGRRTEIDAITGQVVAAAERADIRVPVNRTLWNLVRSLEIRATGETG